MIHLCIGESPEPQAEEVTRTRVKEFNVITMRLPGRYFIAVEALAHDTGRPLYNMQSKDFETGSVTEAMSMHMYACWSLRNRKGVVWDRTTKMTIENREGWVPECAVVKQARNEPQSSTIEVRSATAWIPNAVGGAVRLEGIQGVSFSLATPRTREHLLAEARARRFAQLWGDGATVEGGVNGFWYVGLESLTEVMFNGANPPIVDQDDYEGPDPIEEIVKFSSLAQQVMNEMSTPKEDTL